MHRPYAPRLSSLLRLSLVLPLTCLAALRPAGAQQTPPRAADSARPEVCTLGLYAGLSLTTLDAGFAVDKSGLLVSSDLCGRFERGSGTGPVAGLLLEVPLTPDLRLAFAAEYEDRSAELRYTCVDPAEIRVGTGLAPAVTEHVATIDHAAVTARLMGSYRPFTMPLVFLAGPAFSVTTHGSYTVREEIVSPAGAEFLTGGQVRPYGAGTLSNGGPLHLALAGGIAYTVPIGERLMLRPEIGYLIGITKSLPSAGITPRALHLTLGITRRFDEPAPVPPPPSPPPTAPAPRLEVTLDAAAVEADGSRSDTITLHAVRSIGTRLHPLLTYLFFDRGSSEIPTRYIRRGITEAALFSESSLRDSSTIGIYHNVLDIIGARMSRMPGATIRVTGTAPDTDPTSAEALGRRRAEQVSRYLGAIWHIDPKRIEIASRRDPATATNPETEDGAAENRRVEITSDNYEIVEPVLISDTTLRLVRYPDLLVTPRITGGGGAGPRQWELLLTSPIDAASRIDRLHEMFVAGSDTPAPVTIRLDSLHASAWQLGPDGAGSLNVVLNVSEESTMRSAMRKVPVRLRIESDSARFGAGYYSLILFDFGSARLRPEHLRTIQIVNDRTSSTARARVLGYTDRLGEAELNRRLSSDRAAAVSALLRATVTESVGIGEETTIYDNDLPEGRFYSRSVTIQTGE